MITVYTESYSSALSAFPVCKKEVLRYAGVRDEKNVSEAMDGLYLRCLSASDIFSPMVCYAQTETAVSDGIVTLGSIRVASRDLAKNLSGCGSAVIFAATLGNGIDRLAARKAVDSPAEALMLEALGNERIEAVCDLFCENIKKHLGASTAPRFSPGYGNLPIDFQRDIFSLLGCGTKIGVSLTEGLMMLPSKSVTAIMGIRREK